MKCLNCKAIDYKFEEKYGATVCNVCGYIMISHIFDNYPKCVQTRTMPRYSDSLDNGLVSVNMLCAEFNIKDELVKKIHSKYRNCLMNSMFDGYSFEERAVTIVYLVLQENKAKVIISDFADFLDVRKNNSLTLARNIAKVVRPTDYYSFLVGLPVSKANKDTIKRTVALLEDNDWTVTKNMVGAIAYDVLRPKVTQTEIFRAFGMRHRTLKVNLQKVRELIKWLEK